MTEAEARDALEAAGVPEPAGDAARLRRLAPDDATFAAWIARRARREPVSRITGRRAFWNHDFIVTPDVLDPRPDTEALVEAALSAPFERVLDLGTGSGCILVSLLAERETATGIGTDLSEAALSVAARNAAMAGVTDRASFRRSDWLDGICGTFDLIVSNPPYIAEAEMAQLGPEVRDWEPHLALTPGGDGLGAYRIIARDAPARLRPGGRLMLEIGAGQAEAVCALLEGTGLTRIRVFQDMNGRNRVVSGEKPR